jgi:hypothetical protein
MGQVFLRVILLYPVSMIPRQWDKCFSELFCFTLLISFHDSGASVSPSYFALSCQYHSTTMGQVFLRVILLYPVNIIPRQWGKCFSELFCFILSVSFHDNGANVSPSYFSLSCQYHSTTMGQVFLRVILLYPVSIIPRCYVILSINSVANNDTPNKEYKGIRFILGQQRTSPRTLL